MSNVISLSSYAADHWLPAGGATELVSAIDGSVVATMPASADAAAMLDHARRIGGPALRAMTFQQRGKILRALADALTEMQAEAAPLQCPVPRVLTDDRLLIGC